MIKETIIKLGKLEPVPQIGDKLKEGERLSVIEACDCANGKGDPSCGPHFVRTDEGYRICMVYWHLNDGWSYLVDGAILIQDQSEITVVTYDLKIANTSPSATHCLRCGGQLKDPGMGPIYKHCPKCEP